MFLERAATYTCFHRPNTDRQHIIDAHMLLFGSAHKVVAVGAPEDSRLHELCRTRISNDQARYTQKLFDDSLAVLIHNLLLAQQGLTSTSKQMTQIGLRMMGENLVKSSQGEFAWAKARPLKRAEISLSMKHKYALGHFLVYSQKPYCLILEDDALIRESSLEVLDSLCNSPHTSVEDGTLLYADLSLGCNMRISELAERGDSVYGQFHAYTPLYPSSRTTCAYLVNREMAVFFLSLFYDKYLAPIDIELMFAMTQARILKINQKCIWIEPEVFSHGSESEPGMESSIGH